MPELPPIRAALLGLTDVLDLHVDVTQGSDADAIHRVVAAQTAATVPLVTAVARAMAEAAAVSKSSLNKDQGYKFASAEAILAAVRGPLLARGVLLTPHPRQFVETAIQSRGGSKGSLITLDVDFVFRNGAGEELRVDGWKGQGQDYGDKALGKAYTNAVKTFVRTAWLLPTEHDDPEATPSGERAAPEGFEPPVWARPAADTLKASTLAELTEATGDERASKLLLAECARMTDGSITNATAGAVRVIVAALAARQAAADQDQDAEAPAPELTRDEQIAAGTGPEVIDDTGHVYPAADVEPPPPAGPDPGSVEVPELPADPGKAIGTLQAAGCICTDPLATQNTHPVYNDACPLSGHGIPF